MKKFVSLVLVLVLVVALAVTAYSYFALSLDCADTDEYAYSDAVFYYPDLNVVVDYDAEVGLYFFYDGSVNEKVYLPDLDIKK